MTPKFKYDAGINFPTYTDYNPRGTTLEERKAWYRSLPTTPQPVPGQPGYYVTRTGQFFKEKKDGGLVKLAVCVNQGRRNVALGPVHTGRGKGKWRGTGVSSRAVYLTFIGPLADGIRIDHIKDKALVNDAAWNLQGLTNGENCRKGKTGKKMRRGFAYEVTAPSGEAETFPNSAAAARAHGVDSKRITDAADFGNSLRSGHHVRRLKVAI